MCCWQSLPPLSHGHFFVTLIAMCLDFKWSAYRHCCAAFHFSYSVPLTFRSLLFFFTLYFLPSSHLAVCRSCSRWHTDILSAGKISSWFSEVLTCMVQELRHNYCIVSQLAVLVVPCWGAVWWRNRWSNFCCIFLQLPLIPYCNLTSI